MIVHGGSVTSLFRLDCGEEGRICLYASGAGASPAPLRTKSGTLGIHHARFVTMLRALRQSKIRGPKTLF